MKKKKVNIYAINAKSGAGKDYVVSLINYIVNYVTSDNCIRNMGDNLFNYIRDVSDSNTYTLTGIDWGRSDLKIQRYSTPLRNIVQSIANTSFNMVQMDMQEVKKYQPSHLPKGMDLRKLHMLLADAIKDKLQIPDIFSILLNDRIDNDLINLSKKNDEFDIIIQDLREQDELDTLLPYIDKLKKSSLYDVNFKLIHITADEFNAINHKSEQDLYGNNKDIFDIVYHNDKTLSMIDTLLSVNNGIVKKLKTT